MPIISLLDLGSAITGIFAFLAPDDQHKLRSTSSAMCEWFDSAAENGSLAFFVTFATAAGPLRWRHAICNPRGARSKAKLSIPPATVTMHARNYYLSTFNLQAGGEADDAIIDKATIELVADFPFEHKLVVTGLFGIRSIGDGFCKGVKAVEVEFTLLKSQLEANSNQLESVGKGWMSNCPKLRHVTCEGFSTLKNVGDSWLYSCSYLGNITFDVFPRLRRIGNRWMSSCSNLKHIDLTGFTAMEEVGDNWISDCSSLENITLPGDMPKLKKIGRSWMSSCLRLRNVDFLGFTALEGVGDSWMYNCSALECITFSGCMSRLKKIGSNWLSQCSNLKHVDFTGFTALEEVGNDWLYNCSALESITFAGDMPVLKNVGYCWMSSCSSLKHVDFAGFTALEEVGDYWMSCCSSLETVTFAGDMPKLKKVGDSWMLDCSNLKHIDLTGLTALEEVGGDWLRACMSLESCTLAGDIPKLKQVGGSWTPKSDRPIFEYLLHLSKCEY